MVYCLKICGKAGWKVTDSKRPEPKKQEANLADEILPPIKEHLEQAHTFLELLMQYKCALMEVETKLNVLKDRKSVV